MTTTTTAVTDSPLHLAAMRGDYLELGKLIEAGADVNALDHQGRTVVACTVIGEDWENPQPYIIPEERDSNDNDDENENNNDEDVVVPLDRYRVLCMLFQNPDISLFTLNAPQRAMKGVTPLGFAAYINDVKFVKTLLVGSGNRVAVDGMDTHGATPLMYAARDNRFDVVNVLLASGARPDFRDSNHITAIQFGLPHLTTLCLLENALRQHRWYESQSTTRKKIKNGEVLLPLVAASLIDPRSLGFSKPEEEVIIQSTITLVRAILSSKTWLIYRTLFPPIVFSSSQMDTHHPTILVNRPDSSGWSPIHYCVSHEKPSIEALDALYCAGADMSIFTTNEHYTPLHCLAKCALPSSDDDPSDKDTCIYQFAIHLIRDLRAPLSAHDKHEETCLHIAAEHGESLDVLLAFLDCDATGAVRQMRNDRGLTPLEVAKPEFRVAFETDLEKFRSSTIYSSNRHLRLTPSFVSISSLSRRIPVLNVKLADEGVIPSTPDFDISAKSKLFLSLLRITSPRIKHDISPNELKHFELTLRQATQLGQQITGYLRNCVEDTVFENQGARIMCSSLNSLSENIKLALEISCSWPGQKANYDRSSDYSEKTIVASNAFHWDAEKIMRIRYPEDDDYLRWEKRVEHRDISVSTDDLDQSGEVSPTTLVETSDSSACDSEPAASCKTNRTADPSTESELASTDHESTNGVVKRSLSRRTKGKFRSLMKKRVGKEEKSIADDSTPESLSRKEHETGGTKKLKAWIRRKIWHDLRVKMVWQVDDELDCAVGREVKQRVLPPRVLEEYWNSYEMNWRHIDSTIPAVTRDLEAIGRSLDSVDGSITDCQHSLARIELVVRKALQKREAWLESAQLHSEKVTFDDLFVRLSPPSVLDLPSSSSSSSSARRRPKTADSRSSVRSYYSMASFATEGDDEDTRSLRRLFRKTEAKLCGAWDGMDQVEIWLRIAKEILRGVKREAYI